MSSTFVSNDPRKLLLIANGRVVLTMFTKVTERSGENFYVDPNSQTVLGVVAVYVAGACYQLLMVYDTLANRNIIQTTSLCIFSAILSIYTVLQLLDFQQYRYYSASHTTLQSWETLLISQACLTGLATLVTLGVGWRLSREFQWSILERLNADLLLRRRYFILQVGVLSFPVVL